MELETVEVSNPFIAGRDSSARRYIMARTLVIVVSNPFIAGRDSSVITGQIVADGGFLFQTPS